MSKGPENLSVRDAWQYFLDDRKNEVTDWTHRSYHYRLKMFVEWCEENGVETVDDINGWQLNQYKRALQSQGNSSVTMKGKLMSVKQLLDYLYRIDAVDEELPEKALDTIPKVSRSEQTSDTLLAAEDAEALLGYYRNSTAEFATPRHAVLEVFWNTGARLGSVFALDLRDFSSEEQYLQFQHRPESDTPLKNKEDGERVVSISEEVVEVLDAYIARDRHDKRDDHGREALFTSRQGRASSTTLRCWCYVATQPCVHMRCPHGEQKEACDYRHRNKGSQCPSSRSPHQVRTGSITWHRDRGVPMEVTADRVNASPKVIERYYDKATEKERMENRRREHVSDLDIGVSDE